MRDVVNAWVVFFGYAVLAVFAQNAIFTRALGVSRLVQLVGDDRTSSWLFGLQLCITQVLVAPLAWYAGSWIVPLEKGTDFLNLPSGRQIQIPFDQLLVFSTNLPPKGRGLTWVIDLAPAHCPARCLCPLSSGAA